MFTVHNAIISLSSLAVVLYFACFFKRNKKISSAVFGFIIVAFLSWPFEFTPLPSFQEQLHKYLMRVYMVVNGNQLISKGSLHQLFTKSLWRSERFQRVPLCSFCNLTARQSKCLDTYSDLPAVFRENEDAILSPTAVAQKVKTLRHL